MPRPAPWVTDGQLLLTTGYAWPREPEAERRQIDELAARGLTGIGLAVPGYVEHFSTVAREAAETHGLPLLEIPWDVPFATITEELHRELLTLAHRTIVRSEQIHRALTRAAGDGTTLQDLACELGRLIGRATTIEDPNGKLLGVYAVPAQDDAVRRETVARTQSPRGLIAELERRGHLATMRAALEPVRLPALHELGLASRLVCPIRVGGEIAGFVWIIEGDEPLGELDFRAAEHAALVAALHIAHQRELATLESRLGYASFLSLLEAPGASPRTLERALLLGFDPEVAYRVAIAVLEEPLPLGRDGVLRREALTERLRRALVACGVQRPMLGASLNRIPFLVPENVALEEIADAIDDPGVRIVAGQPHTGTGGVSAGYGEAQFLIEFGGSERVLRYEDVLVPRVLLGDAAARDAFLKSFFAPLEGRRGGAALREALLSYAHEGFAFRKTADALGIHPNTLRYRLERASEAIGIALDDAETRFRLQLAARLHGLSGEGFVRT
jgi:purine catabolism regulator